MFTRIGNYFLAFLIAIIELAHPSHAGEKIVLKMKSIPSGTFLMGQTADRRHFEEIQESTVRITRAFSIMDTEVTQSLYQSVMGTLPSTNEHCPECPATNISWFKAVDFANRLSKMNGYSSCYTNYKLTSLNCQGYRLPTDAEWEYAARGNSNNDQYGDPDLVAWYAGNSNGKIHPVAKKVPNEYGLFDMLGNADEWVYDVYTASTGIQKTDPIEHGSGNMSVSRVCRGGSFQTKDKHKLSAAFRSNFPPRGFADIGFRLVKTNPHAE